MEEIPNSKVDVKLFRRFPDEEKEVDYGPGYLKLYERSVTRKADDDNENKEIIKAIQVVFRSHGTMKVRASHALFPFTTNSKSDDNDNQNDDEAKKDGFFNVSFENELRYKAVGDVADLVPGSSGVYGQEQITQPQDFPVSFEFHEEPDRDSFIELLREHLCVVDVDADAEPKNDEKETVTKEEPKPGKGDEVPPESINEEEANVTEQK